MHASLRLLLGMIIVVSLAGCGPTASAPARTVATAAPLGSAATPLARATMLVVPTSGGTVASTPDASPASAVAATIAPQDMSTPSMSAVTLPDGSGGVGFDDLRYDATLGQVLAPGGRTSMRETAVVALIVGIAVLGWRLSGNIPTLNNDPIAGFSPNDWLCPIVTYVCLGIYAALRPPADRLRWTQVRAMLTIGAFVANVIFI
jgi:hypothetical protein